MVVLNIHELRGKLERILMDAKIGTKIMVYYGILLILSIVISSSLYQKINASIMANKVSDVSIQTLHSISANIDSLVDSVNSYSKMLLSNENVQHLLRNTEGYTVLARKRAMYRYMSELMEATSLISSIYIFDNAGNKYAIDSVYPKALKIDDIAKANWYNDVMERRGGYVLQLNAGEIFESTSEGNFVSLIRVINDISSQTPIGILIINISEDSIIKTYREISSRYQTIIMLKDENSNNVVRSNDTEHFNLGALLLQSNHKENNAMTQTIKGKPYLTSYLNISNDWKIISVMPFDELSKESSIFNSITLIMILLNSLLMFLGGVVISKLLTSPINKLLESMKNIEKGEFKEVRIPTSNDEIGKLKDGYNMMIQEIQRLIYRIVEEQKVKRKAELDVLQAQIKPHFLYNTFDAISSLALSGKNEEVYTMMKALGSYYRTSLNKGKEIISIKEEIETVKNYLTIQKMRYGDTFSVDFDIDERVYGYKILKLILQPIAENALYHGIRRKGENGSIWISAKHKGEYVHLLVEDDGVGMGKETIDKILNGAIGGKVPGFGIRGTVERLRIFYGVQGIFTIESKEGYGTKVTITIPAKECAQTGQK